MAKEISKKQTKSKRSKQKGLKGMINSKKVLILIAILIVLIIGTIITVYLFTFNNPKVISINDNVYYKDDYMIYLRLAKSNLFNEDTTELPEATLKTIADKESNITVEEYLRSKVEESLKVAGVIETMARDNKISLTDDQLDEIQKSKKKYISALGGEKSFKNT